MEKRGTLFYYVLVVHNENMIKSPGRPETVTRQYHALQQIV